MDSNSRYHPYPRKKPVDQNGHSESIDSPILYPVSGRNSQHLTPRLGLSTTLNGPSHSTSSSWSPGNSHSTTSIPVHSRLQTSTDLPTAIPPVLSTQPIQRRERFQPSPVTHASSSPSSMSNGAYAYAQSSLSTRNPQRCTFPYPEDPAHTTPLMSFCPSNGSPNNLPQYSSQSPNSTERLWPAGNRLSAREEPYSAPSSHKYSSRSQSTTAVEQPVSNTNRAPATSIQSGPRSMVQDCLSDSSSAQRLHCLTPRCSSDLLHIYEPLATLGQNSYSFSSTANEDSRWLRHAAAEYPTQCDHSARESQGKRIRITAATKAHRSSGLSQETTIAISPHPSTSTQGQTGSRTGSSVSMPEIATLPTSTGGVFHNAHNFVIQNPIFQEVTPSSLDTFMEKFVNYTIRGAAFDSSARDPPPRCHPGTRLSTIEETRSFCSVRLPSKRLLWIVGPAGVGKSAIMQTVAETCPNLGASLFFSVNGRNDPTKIIATLAYQLATKHKQYCHYVHAHVTNSPDLMDKSMAALFEVLIAEPLAKHGIYQGEEPLVIFIDGVDECDGIAPQRKLVELISSLITKYPSAPLVWVLASRPEPHITTLFESFSTTLYHKIELSVQSNKSREDVEKFLRDSFAEIHPKYGALRFFPRWPTEEQFLKIITAASGLFAYGATASGKVVFPYLV